MAQSTEVILSGNEVGKLATFMGFRKSGNVFEKWEEGYTRCLVYDSKDLLAYKSSWDWLMPVWYKFKILVFENNDYSQEYAQFCDMIGNAILNGPSPEPAFNELVKAVTWYNSIKK